MKPAIRRNTPEEDAAIQRGIAEDPDIPEWSDADFAAAKPAAEMIPPEVYASLIRRRGPQKAPKKELVAIRLDRDVAEHLRGTGRGWQGRLNETLRKLVLGG